MLGTDSRNEPGLQRSSYSSRFDGISRFHSILISYLGGMEFVDTNDLFFDEAWNGQWPTSQDVLGVL
jgi:hypothetical protein